MTRIKWLKWAAPAVVGVVAAAALWQTVLSRPVRTVRQRRALMQALRSPDPQTRKQAAWAVTESPGPNLEAFLIRGIIGAERDPDVREAYVYALGRLEDSRNFAAIESAIDSDPSGYVRAAAWLAAARCDPQHFRTLAETHAPPDDPWDRIGIGQGRLFLGDVCGIGELLHWAGAGSDSQRLAAARALLKGLRPLLDAAGRWPIDADVAEGEPWPAELVGEIERRCATLDLQAIMDDLRRHRVPAERVRRNVLRLTGAREHLARLLFAR
jgi:hypothetical protein